MGKLIRCITSCGAVMASFVDSLVAPLSIINALIVAIGRKKQDEISETFERLEKIWDEYDVYEKTRDEVHDQSN